MTPSRIADLERLLEEERRVLLSGDYAQLPRFAAEKEAFMAAMTGPAGAGDAAKLRRLGLGLDRNLALLGAALGGARDALAAIGGLPRSDAAFETYDSRGRPARTATRSAKVERKA